jgi:hypothetical protein
MVAGVLYFIFFFNSLGLNYSKVLSAGRLLADGFLGRLTSPTDVHARTF